MAEDYASFSEIWAQLKQEWPGIVRVCLELFVLAAIGAFVKYLAYR